MIHDTGFCLRLPHKMQVGSLTYFQASEIDPRLMEQGMTQLVRGDGMDNISLKDCFIDSFCIGGKKKAISFFRGARMETEISYQELNRDSNQMANLFRNLSVQKGDRVILFLEKSIFFVVAHIALQKTGAIAVPLNPELKKSELEYLLKDADPKLVLSGLPQAVMLKEIAPGLVNIATDIKKPYQEIDFFRTEAEVFDNIKIGPDNPGLIIYTSGTTGKPKGAVLSQKNLVHDAKNIIHRWEITDADVLCHALPLFHAHGLCFALHTSLIARSHILMLDRFSPETVIKLLSQKKGKNACTIFMAVPTMYGRIMDRVQGKGLGFEHIRMWASGSAPLLIQDFERIKKLMGKEPVEREGMSETGMNFSNPVRGQKKPGSIGLPMPDLRVRIVDPETSADVSGGHIGEIWLKGPCITPGYWRNPAETAEAFKQGWFRTGDLGKVDKDGYYYLTDRIKNIIISGGENISPNEVETVINRLDGVVASSVIGIPDKNWGEKLVAAIVTKSNAGMKAEEVQTFCKKHLLDWKCPREIVFINELPKNTMGKVLKMEVKEFFQNLKKGSSQG